MNIDQKYTVRIEAELWTQGEWNPDDSNTDVFIRFEDGSHWVASFFSYKNIQTLTEKNRRTGELLAGTYFWGSDMILIEKTSREQIEKVVYELIRINMFDAVFSFLPPDEG